MMTSLMLVIILMGQPAPATADYSVSSVAPPVTIRVFRLHRRGSSIPARIEVWDFKRYVGAVMASGAWPNRPTESAKVGAQAIKQYAWWMILHHQPGHSFRGKRYDITDSEQYLKPFMRPWSHVPVRTARAVRAIWSIRLIKNGRLFRTGWSGEGTYCGSLRDGWHLFENGVRACANKGYRWQRIIRIYLSPVEIR